LGWAAGAGGLDDDGRCTVTRGQEGQPRGGQGSLMIMTKQLLSRGWATTQQYTTVSIGTTPGLTMTFSLDHNTVIQYSVLTLCTVSTGRLIYRSPDLLHVLLPGLVFGLCVYVYTPYHGYEFHFWCQVACRVSDAQLDHFKLKHIPSGKGV